MIKLIFAPEYGFESDARERVRSVMREQLLGPPPIPSVARALFPMICGSCMTNLAWSNGAAPAECDDCRVRRMKSGDQLAEDLAARAAQTDMFAGAMQ